MSRESSTNHFKIEKSNQKSTKSSQVVIPRNIRLDEIGRRSFSEILTVTGRVVVDLLNATLVEENHKGDDEHKEETR